MALQPETGAVEAGETLQFTAVAMDEHGNALDGLPIAWRALSAGGSIDGNGALTASVRAGEYGATVEATAAQDSASFTAVAPVTVVPGPLSQVVIGPASVSLGTGMSQQYVVVAGDRFGNPIDEFEPVWTATAGAITEDGLFTAPDTPDRLRGRGHRLCRQRRRYRDSVGRRDGRAGPRCVHLDQKRGRSR